MTGLARWDNPFRELETYINRVSKNLSASNEADDELTRADWMPKVDVKENNQAYLIKAELPGVDKKDVQVTFRDGLLVIRGEKHTEKTKEKEDNSFRSHRVECSYGSFVRSFKLPENVDGEKVSAKFNHGVLELEVPKTSTKQKQIEIDIK